MARAAWWIPILQMAWFVMPVDTERGGESARHGAQLQTLSYDKGQMAVLFCSVSDRRGRTVTWRKLPNRNPLTIDTKTWVKDSRIHAEHVPNSSQWNLVIEKVNSSDAGTYECQVSARGKQFRQQVLLEVRELPAKRYPRIEISGKNYIKQGETIHLQCNATMVDSSVEKLEWFKDRRPLKNEDRTSRVKIYSSVSFSTQLTETISSSLEIYNARVSDSGDYVCRSTERSQLAGMKLEVKPDTVNSKRAENIQQLTGTANGHSNYHSARALLVTVVLVAYFHWNAIVR